jgi:hypothetical protein
MMNWHPAIQSCETPDELLSVARDYLASWEPEELAIVPSQARPTQVKGIDDIAYWHQRLVDCYVTGGARGQGMEEVRSMLHFFALAAQRAAELRGVPPSGEHEGVARLFSERSVPKLFTSALSGAGEF